MKRRIPKKERLLYSDVEVGEFYLTEEAYRALKMAEQEEKQEEKPEDIIKALAELERIYEEIKQEKEEEKMGLKKAKEIVKAKEKEVFNNWRANDGGLTWAAGDYLATISWLLNLFEEKSLREIKNILEQEIEDTLHNESYEISLFLDVLDALEE